jgi:tripartite-type tricarboxylate transporter receptor subunit TctC
VQYRALRHIGSIPLALLMPLCVSARAQPVEEFYRGKQIRVIVGGGEGAGFDVYARLLASFMGKYIPGNPTIIVQNMPGAGGVVAANYVYSIAPQDGTVIGAVNRTMTQAQLMNMPGVQFDSRNFHWIGSLNNEVALCVSSQEGSNVKEFSDLFVHELIIGSSAGGEGENAAHIMNRIMGTKFKVITGYKAGGNILLAMERGEVHGRCSWSWSSIVSQRPQWLKERKINLLAQLAVEKHPDLPHVPLAIDFAKDEDQRKALRFVFARGAAGRPFVLGPGVPQDRVAALRKAFDDMVKDNAVIAEAERQKQELNPVSGIKIQALIEEFYATPKSVIDSVGAQ